MLKSLGLTNVSAPTLNLTIRDVQNFRVKGTRGRANKIISESGLYKLLFQSRKPQAKPFQDWVTRVVLPAIRKDGGYIMGEEIGSHFSVLEDGFASFLRPFRHP